MKLFEFKRKIDEMRVKNKIKNVNQQKITKPSTTSLQFLHLEKNRCTYIIEMCTGKELDLYL